MIQRDDTLELLIVYIPRADTVADVIHFLQIHQLRCYLLRLRLRQPFEKEYQKSIYEHNL